jgi:hypothetical protein
MKNLRQKTGDLGILRGTLFEETDVSATKESIKSRYTELHNTLKSVARGGNEGHKEKLIENLRMDMGKRIADKDNNYLCRWLL